MKKMIITGVLFSMIQTNVLATPSEKGSEKKLKQDMAKTLTRMPANESKSLAAELSTLEKALFIQDANKIIERDEVAHGGPNASMSSMAMLGFAVSSVKFITFTDYSCEVTVAMNKGPETYEYYMLMPTKKGFEESQAAREGKKFSELSDSYKNVLEVCLRMAK